MVANIAALGATVLRSIPPEVLPGLTSGAYTLHGGVVRDSLGQIVAHLVTPSTVELANVASAAVPGLGAVVQSMQLSGISADVARTLNIAMAGTVLSGLGLATSLVGITYLASRISRIDTLAREIKRNQLLEQRARLRAAVERYGLSAAAPDTETRRQLLVSSQQAFSETAHYWIGQTGTAAAMPDLVVSEECYVTASLGNAMCASDLGMGVPAAEALEKLRAEWLGYARPQCGRLLNVDECGRLLDSRYVDSLPATKVVELLDFAKCTSKGVEWIDTMRRSLGKVTMLASAASTVDAAAIDYAKQLKARSDVLDSYVAHFKYLAHNGLSATGFAKQMQDLRKESKADLLWIGLDRPFTAAIPASQSEVGAPAT